MPKTAVEFFRESGSRPFPWGAEFQVLCQDILRKEKKTGLVNVALCSDERVRALNLEFRKQDKVTDVLSFEWHSDGILGEIYIAEAQIKRQAPRYGNSYKAELRRMLVHGILHLCGYDHMVPAERKVMRAREEAILVSL